MDHTSHQTPTAEMHARRTAMEDGRYLIYYTFDDAASVKKSQAHAEKDEPQAVPVAPEESRV